MSAIVIIDALRVAGPKAHDVRARYLSQYAPTAERRGMTLDKALVGPPVLLDDGHNVLTFIWTVPDLPAWWKMRIQGSMDAEALAFWKAIEPDIAGRERTFHVADPEALEDAADV